jgi:hypothetical protein
MGTPAERFVRQHTAHLFRNFSGKALHSAFEEIFVFLRFEWRRLPASSSWL